MFSMNLQRALWASRALDVFSETTGADMPEDAIVDLICDIGHYCDQAELDFVRLVGLAVSHWKVEQTDPETIDPGPEVTITIEGGAE